MCSQQGIKHRHPGCAGEQPLKSPSKPPKCSRQPRSHAAGRARAKQPRERRQAGLRALIIHSFDNSVCLGAKRAMLGAPQHPPAWPPTAQSRGTRACSVASPAHGWWVPPGRKQPGSCWGTAPLAEAEGDVPAPFFLPGQRPAFGARPSSARDFPASCRSRRGGASTRCHGFCPRGGRELQR